MVEAKNFVEKELGKQLDEEQNIEQIHEQKEKETIPTYTPPPPPMQEPKPSEPQFIQQAPIVQIVEKVVYKKQRIHGFFRTLTIIALLAIGFLMLGESTWLIELSINSFKLHQIYPLVIIFSTIIIRSYKWLFGKIFGLILFLWVFCGIFSIGIYTSLNPSTKRKEWIRLNYPIQTTEKNNLYINTLIGNSYIDGNDKYTTIKGTWNSDRHLIVNSGKNENAGYLKINEDKNRNVLQNYRSNINLTLPENKIINFLYIKNFLWLHTIDMTTFQRKTIKIHGGINDITIKVENVLSGNKIEIQGTAANVEINIPDDIGVMMYYKHLVGKLNIPGFESTEKHYFQSQNIQETKATLHLYINLWIGNTKINWVEPKN